MGAMAAVHAPTGSRHRRHLTPTRNTASNDPQPSISLGVRGINSVENSRCAGTGWAKLHNLSTLTIR